MCKNTPSLFQSYRANLITRGHFRPRDKDGGHTIRSVIAENPMAHANHMALSFIEPCVFYRTGDMGDRCFTLRE